MIFKEGQLSSQSIWRANVIGIHSRNETTCRLVQAQVQCIDNAAVSFEVNRLYSVVTTLEFLNNIA